MDDTSLTFSDETAEFSREHPPMPWKVLMVDDEPSVHDITALTLKDFSFEGRGLSFIIAYSAREARACLNQHSDVALMLIDVVMETEDAGLELVEYVRNRLKNDIVQLIIRTGQPGYAPEDRVISKYRINSYFSKTEVTAQKLISQVTASLRTYQISLALEEELARRKTAELRLRELNRTLEKKIEERTRELSRANRLKSQFLANMSHEIRTPMNGIIGMANLLMDEELSARQAEYVSIIQSSGNTLLGLINDILDLSKIEAGQVSFEIRDFNLHGLIRETLDMFSVKAGEKGLDMAGQIDPDLPLSLAGDSLRIKQILVNLVGNALKFTDTGEIGIRAFLDRDLGDHIFLGLEVTDTGPGIDAAFMSRMFDKFSQKDTSTSRKYGGTGLGLAITKQLARLMDGDVRVDNRAGCGARFTVRLRLKKSSGPPPRIHDRERLDTGERARLLDKISRADIRVLVAEDNPTNQRVICMLLEKMHITPDLVSDGEAVLEKMRRNRYDILIMDVQMPKLDGLETTRVIRDKSSDISHKDIHIIALTAMATEGDHLACKRAGMDRFLTKPVHPQKLMRAIARAMAI